MKDFWGPVPYNDIQFKFMGYEHWIIILIIFFISLLTLKMKHRIKPFCHVIRIILGVLILTLHSTKYIWLSHNRIYDLDQFLPLHLSSITSILLGIALVFSHKKLLNVVFFWGLTAGILAILFPDLEYGYNHLRYYQFFLCHGFLFYGSFYMVVIYSFKPTYKNMWQSFMVLLAYAGFVMVMNFILDVNYMTLNEKPRISTHIIFSLWRSEY